MKHIEDTAQIQPRFCNPKTDLTDLLTVPSRSRSSQVVPLDEINRALIQAGASLHWLHLKEKRPVESNWTELPNRTESALRRRYLPGQNIGVRLATSMSKARNLTICETSFPWFRAVINWLMQ